MATTPWESDLTKLLKDRFSVETRAALHAARHRHYCPEWDEMFIDDSMPEFAACLCFKPRAAAPSPAKEK